MEENHVSTDIIKRKLIHIVWGWIQVHWWKLLLALMSFVVGGVSAYIAIYLQLSNARIAAESAKSATDRLTLSIASLVTKEELNAAKDRISELEQRLDYAESQAQTAPRPVKKPRLIHRRHS